MAALACGNDTLTLRKIRSCRKWRRHVHIADEASVETCVYIKARWPPNRSTDAAVGGAQSEPRHIHSARW